jgi:hypothetical protein
MGTKDNPGQTHLLRKDMKIHCPHCRAWNLAGVQTSKTPQPFYCFFCGKDVTAVVNPRKSTNHNPTHASLVDEAIADFRRAHRSGSSDKEQRKILITLAVLVVLAIVAVGRGGRA